ncbi:dynein light chain Tctex-type 5-A-like [Clytia hemisphaerica]|uniref:dynein light chain Tctex-type 5-A-like n=1 Tax=Clytia hemisphaerica TaxID=252671 RepID=UPI0034D4EF0E
MTLPPSFLSCLTPTSRTVSRASSAAGHHGYHFSRITTPALLMNRLNKKTNKQSIERYRLHPIRKYDSSKVSPIMKDVLESVFNDRMNYAAELFGKLTKIASNSIKEKVKHLGFSRYRIVSMVHVGQNLHQGTSIASRTLMDKENDDFTELTIDYGHFFVTAVVYAVYKL